MSREKAEPRQMKLAEYQGVMHLEDTEFEQIRHLTCRPDDIWVCSFPRSGTALTQHMTHLVRTLDFNTASSVPLTGRFPCIDLLYGVWNTPRGCKYVDSLPNDKPRMIKSHLHYFLLPEQLRNGTGKIIYTVRNPKSAAPSMFRLMSYLKQDGIAFASMREYLENFLNGIGHACPWGLHVRQYWDHRTDDNVLFLQYEHTIKDRRKTIGTIAKFLNRDLTDEEIDKIFDATSIDKQRDNKGANFSDFQNSLNTNEGYGQFINTGMVDGWKNDIPEDLVSRFNEMIEKEIGHTDIKFE